MHTSARHASKPGGWLFAFFVAISAGGAADDARQVVMPSDGLQAVDSPPTRTTDILVRRSKTRPATGTPMLDEKPQRTTLLLNPLTKKWETERHHHSALSHFSVPHLFVPSYRQRDRQRQHPSSTRKRSRPSHCFVCATITTRSDRTSHRGPAAAGKAGCRHWHSRVGRPAPVRCVLAVRHKSVGCFGHARPR